MYNLTRLKIGLDSISLECSKNREKVALNKDSVDKKPCINRKSKSDELTI